MSDLSIPPRLGSRRAAFLLAVREAAGVPVLVLGASYVGFGSLVRASGMTLDMALLSTVTTFALPGQVVVVELYAVGASLFAIALAVALTNARLLPMVVALMPHLRRPGEPAWRFYAAANFVAVTAWVFSMRRCPTLPHEQRLPYFVGFGLTMWTTVLATTAVGYVVAGSVPASVSLGLVFLNPIYFMLVLTADLASRARAAAFVAGAALGPVFHRLDPDWGLLATGLVAGSLAFWADRALGRRRG